MFHVDFSILVVIQVLRSGSSCPYRPFADTNLQQSEGLVPCESAREFAQQYVGSCAGFVFSEVTRIYIFSIQTSIEQKCKRAPLVLHRLHGKTRISA